MPYQIIKVILFFFPEYFNAPLMSKFNDKGESQAIRGLAKYTDEIRDRFINLAISYNINIITGSMPYVKEDGLLYNVGFLCRRDGTYEMYEKCTLLRMNQELGIERW